MGLLIDLWHWLTETPPEPRDEMIIGPCCRPTDTDRAMDEARWAVNSCRGTYPAEVFDCEPTSTHTDT